jgi:hypothetical protein
MAHAIVEIQVAMALYQFIMMSLAEVQILPTLVEALAL